jgi:hypothetical protein
MGKLTYDSTLTVDLDDRALAHLQVVISAKLRRGESFQFSWTSDPASGGGRTTIWMNPYVTLSFRYSSGRAPTLNRAWIEMLMDTANSAPGLRLVPEPAPAAARAPGSPSGGPDRESALLSVGA